VPQVADHLKQAERNLGFLEIVNTSAHSYYDWQITVCFYVAVHLVNAHLSKQGMQFRKHTEVNAHLNPQGTSPARIDQAAYLNYEKLFILSRRARYLVDTESTDKDRTRAHLSYEKHLKRALVNLDALIEYFCKKLAVTLPTPSVTCSEIKANEKYLHFTIRSAAASAPR
jgi:hypothetical protein